MIVLHVFCVSDYDGYDDNDKGTIIFIGMRNKRTQNKLMAFGLLIPITSSIVLKLDSRPKSDDYSRETKNR